MIDSSSSDAGRQGRRKKPRRVTTLRAVNASPASSRPVSDPLAASRASVTGAVSDVTTPCPSNTGFQSSQKRERKENLNLNLIRTKATFSIDELSFAGVVRWSERSELAFDALREAQESAKTARGPARLDMPGLGLHCEVLGYGGGRGHDSHLAFSLRMGTGGSLWIDLDPRTNAHRGLYNLRVRITGTACLCLGVEECLRALRVVLRWSGGTLEDEWVRTAHLCLDLPGVDPQGIIAPVAAGKYLTTLKLRAVHGKDGETWESVALGKAPRLRVIVYDKLAEAHTKDLTYQRHLIDRRWHGEKPEVATRVEYQIGRDWMQPRSIDRLEQFFERLGDIVGQLTADDGYATFVVTQRKPDRANKLQGRAGRSPLWQAVAETMRRNAGPDERRLEPVQRVRISDERAIKTAMSYILKVEAARGIYCERPEDVAESLVDHARRHLADDERWVVRRWDKHALQAGTVHEPSEFREGPGLLYRGEGCEDVGELLPF